MERSSALKKSKLKAFGLNTAQAKLVNKYMKIQEKYGEGNVILKEKPSGVTTIAVHKKGKSEYKSQVGWNVDDKAIKSLSDLGVVIKVDRSHQPMKRVSKNRALMGYMLDIDKLKEERYI